MVEQGSNAEGNAGDYPSTSRASPKTPSLGAPQGLLHGLRYVEQIMNRLNVSFLAAPSRRHTTQLGHQSLDSAG
jgi:hypothetical protein